MFVFATWVTNEYIISIFNHSVASIRGSVKKKTEPYLITFELSKIDIYLDDI